MITLLQKRPVHRGLFCFGPFYLERAFRRSLLFESRFESGNLRQAHRIYSNVYNLVISSDINASRHYQWFYFNIQGAQVTKFLDVFSALSDFLPSLALSINSISLILKRNRLNLARVRIVVPYPLLNHLE